MMENDAAYRAMSIGAAAQSALDLMEEELVEAQQRQDLQIFGLMTKGELTPDVAMMAWARKHVLFEIHSRLLAKLRVGRQATKKLAEQADK